MSAVLPHLEITPQRPHWLAGAPGFEPGNGGIKIPVSPFRSTIILKNPRISSHEALAQQPAEHVDGRVALELGAKFDGAILALGGSGQQHQLGIGEFHRDSPFGWRRRLAPSPPKPRSGHEAGGAGSRSANALDQARAVTLRSY